MQRTFLLFLLTVTLGAPVAAAQAIELLVPIDGVQGTDYFIEFYFDHNNAGGLADYQCGDKTWDGNEGTDFALRNFEQMDSGVSVLAAADGVVWLAYDEEFDRNTEWGMASGLGNRIIIEHEGGWDTYYGHLRQNSVRVSSGDTVKAGAVIAEVGSSGNSAGPRLYFEVDSLYEPRDPFGNGACEELPSLWIDPPSYRGEFALLDSGLLDRVPTFAELLDPPESSTEFAYPDPVVTFWMKFENVTPDDRFTVVWDRDGVGTQFSYEFDPVFEFYSIYYYIAWLNLPEDGDYRVTLFRNDQIIASRPFKVGEQSGVRDQPETTTGLNIRYFAGSEQVVTVSPKGSGIVSHVSISLYDLQGRHIYTLLNPVNLSTEQQFALPVDRLSSGQYLLQIEGDGKISGIPVMVP